MRMDARGSAGQVYRVFPIGPFGQSVYSRIRSVLNDVPGDKLVMFILGLIHA